ncbi:MAG TPA: ferritin-like domain-containing protein [Verrucomicrobiae bacterium]|nr:ferritin-like domain-containing protein [Verrucomicrobiae bacterium]
MIKRNKTQKAGRNVPSKETESENNDLRELFLDELADVYSAEKQLLKALPKMAKAAESDELREAFENHLAETETHAKRLEEVAESLDETIKRKTCAAMEGLVEEATDLMKEQKDSSALDAALIAAAQKVEHYEIASYGTLCAWAEQLGESDAAETLNETLNEEKAADELLTGIAETQANPKGKR